MSPHSSRHPASQLTPPTNGWWYQPSHAEIGGAYKKDRPASLRPVAHLLRQWIGHVLLSRGENWRERGWAGQEHKQEGGCSREAAPALR